MSALKFIFAILILAASLRAASAIDIPRSMRVQNIGALCGWACIETLANCHGVYQLRGLRDRAGATGMVARDDTISEYLTTHRVKFRLTKQWSFERSLLEQYANSHGVAVTLRPGNPYSNYSHMVVVTRYDSSVVEFYDSQFPSVKFWRCGRAWFDKWWIGSSVVILPTSAFVAEYLPEVKR